MSNSSVSIGLVAIGRNEGERLKRCLLSIQSDVPVVAIGSASTDGSVAFARSTQSTFVELDMAKPFSAARARNEWFGSLLEHCPDITFVQFVDGACELEPHSLNRAMNFFETQSHISAVCGRGRERYPNASLYNRMCDEEWNTPTGQADACGGDGTRNGAGLDFPIALPKAGTC